MKSLLDTEWHYNSGVEEHDKALSARQQSAASDEDEYYLARLAAVVI